MVSQTKTATRPSRAGPERKIRCLALGLLASGALASGAGACGVFGDSDELPSNVPDPTIQRSAAGAVARYRAALGLLPPTLDWFLTETGVLTDELVALPAPAGVAGTYTGIDSRTELGGFAGTYSRLQQLRGQAHEARGFIAAYAPDSVALVGHLYAVEGLAEVWLADLFCSGVPLSTIDLEGDYTLAPGSSTAAVYQHAAALFDSALARTGDSVSIQQLAALGRGRALLALGQYGEAAATTATVPTLYTHQVVFAPTRIEDRLLWQFGDATPSPTGLGYRARPATPSVADREGGSGLDYRTAADPRVGVTALEETDPYGNVMVYPTKYPLTGAVTLTVGDGLEARLIEAEAELQSGGDWLALLNTLRTDGTFDTQPNIDDPSKTDTVWHAGTGGVAGLRPLEEPGAVDARVDLLFRERAFWLYLTGHRQGDLRRLLRQYGRAVGAVYPMGAYSGSGTYGPELAAPVPPAESQFNPQYTGCLHRTP